MAHRRPGRRRRRRIDSTDAKASPASAAGGKGREPGVAGAEAATLEAVDPMVGTTLGRCRIEARIGQGRTAMVYRAHHEALDATVAVKVLLPHVAANPQLVERFQTEARAIAKIDNENVVKVYDVGLQDGKYFLVMELLEGEEVYDIVNRDGQMDVMDALRITRQAANGLAAAHGRDIVHRDVKPQNLVLLEDGTVKVVDFGLAAATEEGSERVGTPHFMAPETCATGETKTASDVYSLGISLYLMLTGKPPYAGKDVRAILKAHVEGEPLRPERARPGLQKEVATLVRKLTAREPGERPSVSHLIAGLDRFGGEAVQEKSTLRRRRSRTRAHMAAKQKSSTAPLLVAAVVVVGAVVAVIALSSGKDSDRGGDPSGTRVEQPSTPAPTPPPTPSQPAPVEPPTGPSAPTPPPPVEPPKPADPEEAAATALAKVEAWARSNWRNADDDDAVGSRYADVARNHGGTEAGKEASRRATEIRFGRRHPHPDKVLAGAAEVAAAKEAWVAARPEVDKNIREHLYFRAKKLIPATTKNAAGQFGKEMTFWRGLLDHLVDFKTGMMAWVKKLPDGRREISTPEGRGRVERVSDVYVSVLVDGKQHDFLWSRLEPVELAALAQRAFQEAPPQYMLDLLAFAFAHRTWDAFWAAELDLGMRRLDADQNYMLEEYRRRQPEQAAGG